ncbi:4-(cytidine 5'-diphospho)-2-C-methyl-D-erythritol kinase [Niveibacterium umoris]|uniref:4-diphosphocytidyl-2-C-methyl-D-erythritol kinase n=1 Tax=Niveibacterium umoris TaxID=1193620 RepID=A0A840BRG9_9RHOO|nr:4-(cytidine 5'-diphospho)-2-C-methyl-D-erythritol kinase [Niveibacterium umoris]MBB4012997.1 4-diphosphocytidyl-2-C-methyl-D-erythritol kinase [Niveibacterium umoris]
MNGIAVKGRVARVPAPGKLNLFLHVVGRRPDGYHLLQSAFRLIDRCDWITLSLREDGEIRRTSTLEGVPPEQDLVVRAARLLQKKAGVRVGADIDVEKVLPMGGGLGGGSSDAAAVLLALNVLWGVNAERATLQDWALELGADVPFFVFGRSAFVEGIGERIQPMELEPAWYVVVEPGVSVPTAEIFSDGDLTRNTEPIILASFPGSSTRNDLQPVVCRRYPAVADAVEMLDALGEARMSGSGACVFLACESESEAQAVLAKLPEGTKAWVARGLDWHPLHDWAGPGR